MKYYNQTPDSVYEHIKTRKEGLTAEERTQRLDEYGLNMIRVKGEPLWRKIVEPFANVFMAVLLGAAALSLFTGHALDAVIIIAIIAVSAVIYYVQRISTERVLKALQKHDTQTVTVLVDGRKVSVDTAELVPGDIVYLSEGEKIPADGRIIQEDDIRTDESMLTGESLPISKQAESLEGEKPIYERDNMLFQGSYVVSGRGSYIVTSTAMDTEFGKLAQLATPTGETSPAQAKIDSLITRLIGVIAVVVLLTFGLAIYRGIELSEAVRYTMSIAVSAVPEGLIVATTVILVLGMRRLAKYNALARSMKAVENIGIITTIASDKTGTLTKNQLRVQESWHPERSQASFAQWLMLSANDTESGNGDPLDVAMIDYAKQESASIPDDMQLAQAFPFDQGLAMSGNIWRDNNGGLRAILKGAPEQLISQSYANDPAGMALAEKSLSRLTGMGYRVIAVAEIQGAGEHLEELNDLPLDTMQFVGLVGIADELRPEAKQAIRDAQAAGITVRMITGDHAETAYAIGKKLGLVEERSQVMDCREIGDMGDEELKEKVASVRVYARVIPEAKHRILSVLKIDDVAAMTGDGVNDVPALTNAHVGIAMGSGSQIAKESGDIVLLDDNIASVVEAVRGGRVIFDNIRRMMFYLLSTNLGEVIVMVGALIIGMPLPLVAVQILWINLVTDTAFVIPLGLEKAESNVMKRPPRAPKRPLLDRHMVIRLLMVALTMSVGTLLIFNYMFEHTGSHEYAQTIAFMVLVVAQWANALNARSEFSSILSRMRVLNGPMIVGASIAVFMQMLVMFGPLQDALHVVPVEPFDLLWPSVLMFVLVIVVVELHKLYTRLTMSKEARM